MYKSTQDQADFLNRVASHATKPSRRGIIKDIPAWAAEPEEYYNSVLEQYDLLTIKLHDAREKVIWLRRQLQMKLPYETYKQIKDELDHAGPTLVDLEQEAGNLRRIVRAASVNAWGAVFYAIAKQKLDERTFRALDDATKEILGRMHQQLAPSDSEKSETSEHYRQKLRQKEHHARKRRKVRRALDSGTYRAFKPKSGTWHAR